MKAAVTIFVFCVAALLALGMVMLYSSSMAESGTRYLVMQLTWCCIGMVFCVAAASIDYRWLKKAALPSLGLAVVLLGLVLIAPEPYGMRINGARRWFNLGGFRFQPSEFAKLALIIALAWYGEHYQRQMHDWRRGLLIPGAFIGMVLALIFVEPDWGSTMLLAAISGILLLIAGLPWKHFVAPSVLGIGGLAFSLWHNPLRIKRVMSWLSLEESREDVGYQAYQAMLAFGAGGWSGLGLGNSRQKLGFIPEHHTDFIFSIIGEELGLAATLLIVIAFIAIVICGIYIAFKSPDTFGMLLGAGISFLIGLQAFINIGVVTSALPNKGLPLPFISYGGSNLLMMLTCVGILLSIARRARASEVFPARGRTVGEPDGALADNPFRAPARHSSS